MADKDQGIVIDEKNITFKAARSSGPGGQNVNKLNTKVTIYFDLAGCDCLSNQQKKTVSRKLKTRINKEGQLWVTCQKFRTQQGNFNHALQRLKELLTAALLEKKPRIKTKTPFGAREKRIREKKHRSKIKQLRAAPAGQ